MGRLRNLAPYVKYGVVEEDHSCQPDQFGVSGVAKESSVRWKHEKTSDWKYHWIKDEFVCILQFLACSHFSRWRVKTCKLMGVILCTPCRPSWKVSFVVWYGLVLLRYLDSDLKYCTHGCGWCWYSSFKEWCIIFSTSILCSFHAYLFA